MGAAHDFDSDWDYFESLMTPEEKIAEAITEDESMGAAFAKWMNEQFPRAAELVIANYADAYYLETFAKQRIDEEGEP